MLQRGPGGGPQAGTTKDIPSSLFKTALEFCVFSAMLLKLPGLSVKFCRHTQETQHVPSWTETESPDKSGQTVIGAWGRRVKVVSRAVGQRPAFPQVGLLVLVSCTVYQSGQCSKNGWMLLLVYRA